MCCYDQWHASVWSEQLSKGRLTARVCCFWLFGGLTYQVPSILTYIHITGYIFTIVTIVGGWTNPFEKYAPVVKLDHLPRDRGENQKTFKKYFEAIRHHLSNCI